MILGAIFWLIAVPLMIYGAVWLTVTVFGLIAWVPVSIAKWWRTYAGN